MTDAEIIIALAEKVMGWTVVRFDDDDRKEDVLPRLVENIERNWVLVRRESIVVWNPLTSDSDAFMLVDALEEKGIILHRLQNCFRHDEWVALFIFINPAINWIAAEGNPDRRRAIVLAALQAVEAGAAERVLRDPGSAAPEKE